MTIANQSAPKGAPAPRRMTLGAVTTASGPQPLRVLLYAPEGCGKTTFGAAAPRPIFLGPEDGTAFLPVKPPRFPEPVCWTDVLDAVRELTTQPHDYQTLVLDTLDWIEPLVWQHICRRDNQRNVEAYGYGKGYVAALDEWRLLVGALEQLRRAKRMHVVALSHAHIKPYKNPEGDDYDRFTLKIHDKAGGLWKEWSDAVLFANYETFLEKDGNRTRATGGGARFLHTQRRAAFDAKNRFDLPARLPLDWAEFALAASLPGPAVAARCDGLRVEIRAALAALGDEKTGAQVEAWLAATGDVVATLEAGLNRLRARLADSPATATDSNPTTKEV